MSDIRMTTQSAVRESFWHNCGSRLAASRIKGKTQNDYPADVRMAFVDYVDMLALDGDITDSLANKVTL